MDKQVIKESSEKSKNPHNKKVEAKQPTKRFTDKERKEKESIQRSIGGF